MSSASATAPSPTNLRLGILFNAKKRASFLSGLFNQERYNVRRTGTNQTVTVEVVVLENEHQLHTESCLDILLMKLTDMQTTALYAEYANQRETAARCIAAVSDAIALHRSRHPLTVIEDFALVEQLLDRAKIQDIVKQMQASNGDDTLCAAPSALLYQQHAVADGCTTATGSPVIATPPPSTMFPVICKSIAACGTPASHRMYVLHEPEDIPIMLAKEAEVRQLSQSNVVAKLAEQSSVWLMQQYINHAGVLYKVYVLDEEVQVVAKRSLPDLSSASPSYWLNSQDMLLHPLGDAASSNVASSSESLPSIIPADVLAIARTSAARLKQTLGLALFGFDIIRSTMSGKSSTSVHSYYIVDINYFPSYKTLTDLDTKLLEICVKKHFERQHEMK